MRRWIVENHDTSSGVPLDWRLNNLEESGRKIKEIIFLGQTLNGHVYQIIYTEEDIIED